MLAGTNLGLVFMRQAALDDDCAPFIASRRMVDARSFYSNKGIVNLAPLYIYQAELEPDKGLCKPGDRKRNPLPAFTKDLESQLGMRFVDDGTGDLIETFGPEDVFHYIYAVFHSPAYRERHGQFSRADFPRVPPPARNPP